MYGLNTKKQTQRISVDSSSENMDLRKKMGHLSNNEAYQHQILKHMRRSLGNEGKVSSAVVSRLL